MTRRKGKIVSDDKADIRNLKVELAGWKAQNKRDTEEIKRLRRELTETRASLVASADSQAKLMEQVKNLAECEKANEELGDALDKSREDKAVIAELKARLELAGQYSLAIEKARDQDREVQRIREEMRRREDAWRAKEAGRKAGAGGEWKRYEMGGNDLVVAA